MNFRCSVEVTGEKVHLMTVRIPFCRYSTLGFRAIVVEMELTVTSECNSTLHCAHALQLPGPGILRPKSSLHCQYSRLCHPHKYSLKTSPMHNSLSRRNPNALHVILFCSRPPRSCGHSTRQSITPLSPSQINAFEPYSYYAAAAYCTPAMTLAWNCGGIYSSLSRVASEY